MKTRINSFTLHIIAMTLMLCDHIWATVYRAEWLNCIGRMAFPIFAFLCVEGYLHTKDIKKYILRMFIFACISEIPFNLMYAGSIRFPLHQNVLWTFLFALIGLYLLEKCINKKKWWSYMMISIIILLSFIIGYITMIDYHGIGILTVYVFYLFRKRHPVNMFLQFLCLFVFNNYGFNGHIYYLNIFGVTLEIARQSFALLALIPIWLYNGKQGHYNRKVKYCFYAFYPLHLLILGIIR